MLHVAHEMPFGATVLPQGGTLFSLWAPAARAVQLQLEGQPGRSPRIVPAQRQDDGLFHVTVPSAWSGTRYRWLVGKGSEADPDAEGELLAVPDPASRYNPEGPHGPSEVVDPRAFAWHEAEAEWTGRPWHESVIYELHVGSFTPEGSYAAAAARLPELLALGISVVELMPLASFPGRFGWGYDGVLPFAPHAAYGRPEDLKAFVQAAHQLGIAVWLDVVYNHFGPDGNYLHAYAPAFFSKTHRTAWGDGMNFDGPDAARVREFFVHNALYWLGEFRFDGLRLDAVHAIVDDSLPHLLEELSAAVRDAFPTRRVHLVLENEKCETAWLAAPGTRGRYDGQWHDELHHALHVLLTGERQGYYAPFAAAPLETLARLLVGGCTGPVAPEGIGGRACDGAGDAATAPRRREALPTRFVNFLQNHDQVGNRARGERLSVLADPAALRLATAVCLLAPGMPMLFMGEEHDERQPFLYFADWDSPLREAVREGRAREFAAFIGEAGDALPDPGDMATFSASRPDLSAASAARARQRFDEIRGWLAVRRRRLEPLLPQLRGAASDTAPWPHESRVLEGGRLVVRWRFADGQALELRARFAAGPAVSWGEGSGLPPLSAGEVIAQVGRLDGPEGHERFGPWSASWTLGREGLAGG